MQSILQRKIADNEYILSARLEIEKVNDMFDLDLPESDDYMTISGFILHEYQSFPKLNELIKIGRYEFKIIKNTMNKDRTCETKRSTISTFSLRIITLIIFLFVFLYAIFSSIKEINQK